ncbi:putative TrmH family tRNA/rRNA methyltransferase [bioreactor metagenome]|uniref:Putative TrmH family tRNA/rRNA methyltransferase n=1 Tax=bioreactor metagenome TaxID=1076179 RepID=A0A645HD73_9ZZZZ
MPNKDSAQITPTAIKTSAGALNYIKVIKVQDLIFTIEKLKEIGFWIVGADVKGNENYCDNIYDKPTVVIIGSEGKGISPSLLKHCDHLVKINMYGKINSLNASVSAGILFFEIQRQRNNY